MNKLRRGGTPGSTPDAVWLVMLVAFVVAGMPITTFHGDESMQIYSSHDYALAFIYGEPERLTTDGDYEIDSDAYLRILNGSVNRYAIGLSWDLAGFTDSDLPPRPGWDWSLSYDRNVEDGNRPSAGLLAASRLSSTIFLALSVVVLFSLAWHFRGRHLAWIVSGLYALNPVILLNGRRAMMEGSLLFFGLLTILMAAIVSQKRAQGDHKMAVWWLGLIVSGGLAAASKHSGFVYVAGGLGWILVAEALRRPRHELMMTAAKLVLSGASSFAIFLALSPALWNNPPARLRDLIRVRIDLIEHQVIADPDAPLSVPDRIRQIVTQPFMTPVAHFETGGWTDFSVTRPDIERYMASPLSGLRFGPVLGAALMLLTLSGLFLLLHPGENWRVGLLAWLVPTIAMLLVNPLPWQRYYIPLIPILTLLAGLSIDSLLARIVNRPE